MTINSTSSISFKGAVKVKYSKDIYDSVMNFRKENKCMDICHNMGREINLYFHCPKVESKAIDFLNAKGLQKKYEHLDVPELSKEGFDDFVSKPFVG